MPAARAVAAPDKDTLAVNEAPRKAVHEAAEHRTEQSGDPDEDRRLRGGEDVERKGQVSYSVPVPPPVPETSEAVIFTVI